MKNFQFKKPFSLLLIGTLLSVMTSYALSQDKVDKVTKPVHKHHQVQITGFEFVPNNLTVKAGDIVTWVNKDVVPHNVYDSADKKAISPDLATGKSFSYIVPAFKASGTLGYFCSFHPSMMGKLSQ